MLILYTNQKYLRRANSTCSKNIRVKAETYAYAAMMPPPTISSPR